MITKNQHVIAVKSLRQDKTLRDLAGMVEAICVLNPEISGFHTPAFRGADRIHFTLVTMDRSGLELGDGRDELLALADGRRTVRDLAFALGCGVYATMLQVARMRAEGLLVPPDHWPESPAGDAETASGLPRRRKDRPSLPRRGGEAGGWTIPATIRLLRPRGEGNKRPGEAE